METKTALTKIPKLAMVFVLLVALTCAMATGPAQAFAAGSGSSSSKSTSAASASSKSSSAKSASSKSSKKKSKSSKSSKSSKKSKKSASTKPASEESAQPTTPSKKKSASDRWDRWNERINAYTNAYASSYANAYIDWIANLPILHANNVRFGNSLLVANEETSSDLTAIGQQVNVKSTTAKASLLAAGLDVAIEDSSSEQDILATGQNVTISNTTAKTIAAVGGTVSVGGTCDDLVVSAETVFIDGVVNGDANVDAGAVEIGPNAQIEGTLYMTGPNEPVVQEGAQVPDIAVVNSIDDYVTAVIDRVVRDIVITILIILAILGFFGALIIALLSEWLLPRQTAGAAKMIHERKGYTIWSGIIGAIAIPLIVAVLIFAGITMPVASSVGFAALSLSAAAAGFMGASVFRLVFKNMGRFARTLIGGLIMGVLSAIPIVGLVVKVIAFVYLLGYVLQSVYLNMRAPSPAAAAGTTADTADPAPTNVIG